MGEERRAAGGPLLCVTCRADLPLVDWPVCPRCAAPVPEGHDNADSCHACRAAKLKFDRTLALGSYEGLLGRWIARMKEDRSGLALRGLVELAWERMGERLAALPIDVVTAVPMTLGRRWQRRRESAGGDGRAIGPAARPAGGGAHAAAGA